MGFHIVRNKKDDIFGHAGRLFVQTADFSADGRVTIRTGFAGGVWPTKEFKTKEVAEEVRSRFNKPDHWDIEPSGVIDTTGEDVTNVPRLEVTTMPDNRPEYVTCVSDNHADNKGKAWCGRHAMGFHFTGLDHAVMNARNKGRLLICKECWEAVTAAVDGQVADGTEEPDPEEETSP
jgi:hypothetical protein